MRFTYYGENKEKGFDRMFTVAVRNESEYKSIKYALLKLREDYYKVSDVPELNEDAYWVWAITSDFIENRADAKGIYDSIKYESKLYSDKVKKLEKLDIPFSEKLSSGLDDDFDIFAYDGSMSFEDFKKVQELYTKEAEAEIEAKKAAKKCEKFSCDASQSEFDDFCVLGMCESCRERSCFSCRYFDMSKCPEYKPKENAGSCLKLKL